MEEKKTKIEGFTTGRNNPRYIIVYNTWLTPERLIVQMKNLKPKDWWPIDENKVAVFIINYS